jgi:hypothetical protein
MTWQLGATQTRLFRFRLYTAMGRNPRDFMQRWLVQKSDEPDPFVRYALVTAMTRIGRATKSWDDLCYGLASTNAVIRETALLAFRETYNRGAVGTLVDFLKAPSKFSVNGQYSTEAIPSVLRTLAELHRQRPAWDGKWWATQPVKSPPPAKTVEWEGTPLVLVAVRDALKDPRQVVRHAAIDAVQITGDREAAPRLREMFARETDLDTRRAILRSLGALKDAGSADLIAGLLADPTNNAALFPDALAAAGQISSIYITSALIGLVQMPQPADQLIAAIEALGNKRATDGIAPLAVPPSQSRRENPRRRIHRHRADWRPACHQRRPAAAQRSFQRCASHRRQHARRLQTQAHR